MGNDYILKFDDIETDEINVIKAFDNLIMQYKKINQGGESQQNLIVGDKFNLPVLKQIFSLFFGQQNNYKSNQ